MTYPQPDLEKKYWKNGVDIIVGIDEAGRGPLAGPVVAAAATISSENLAEIMERKERHLIRDSKTLSAKQRNQAYFLMRDYFTWGIGISNESTVDRVNILQASFLAMKKALSDLKQKIKSEPEIILLDGNMPIPNISIRQQTIINGDKYVFSISAASIIAKVTRDRIMIGWDEKYPHYGFARHKGYGTKFHFEMLAKHGPCELHRKSFRLL